MGPHYERAMTGQVYHCKEEITPQRAQPDGMIDATILEDLYVRANTLYLIRHGLGRPVKQYSVVFCDQIIKNPKCVRDGDGRFINDADQIGLMFDVGNITVRMRFC